MRHALSTLSAAVLTCALACSLACAPVQAGTHAFTCDRQADGLTAPPAWQSATGTAAATASYSEAERACWADWAHARELATGPDGLWVDVRDEGARRQLGLPGVAVADLADVPARTFLWNQSLVLIGTGVDLKALSQHCAALRQSGRFKSVHVLLHGVRGWRQVGQTVQAGSALAPPDEISAQEFWLGAAQGLWRVATLGLDEQAQARLPQPVAFAASTDDLPQAMSALAARIAGASEDLSPQRWLVVAASAAQLSRARVLWRQQSAARNAALPPVAWLSGAWPAYAAYRQHQQTLAAHAGRPLPRLCGL